MKSLKIIINSLIIASLIGSQYPITDGVSFADMFCLAIAMVEVPMIWNNRWRIDNYCRWTIVYMLIMLLSSLVNLTITSTVFLNYFRIFLHGIIIYVAVYNTIKNKKDQKIFLYFFVIYVGYFVFNTNSFMQSSYQADVTNVHNFTNQLTYGRNSWGFTGLMLAFFSLFLFGIKRISITLLTLSLGFCAFVILLSASRFSTIFMGILLLWNIYSNRKKASAGGVAHIVVLFIGGMLLFLFLTSKVSGDVLDSVEELLFGKLDKASSDLENTRVEEINILPITNWLVSATPHQLLIGDGKFIGHSIFAHTFCSTGLIGLFYYVWYNFKTIQSNFKRKTLYSTYFAFFVFMMFSNDFITNSRFIILINNLLFMLIAAYISKSEIIYRESIRK